jgi:hypothetical protein
MAVPQIVSQDQAPLPAAGSIGPWSAWVCVVVCAVLAVVIGTWLVWFSASLQRRFQEEDIRAACQRVMPETVERCVDTVTIQRGGCGDESRMDTSAQVGDRFWTGTMRCHA